MKEAARSKQNFCILKPISIAQWGIGMIPLPKRCRDMTAIRVRLQMSTRQRLCEELRTYFARCEWMKKWQVSSRLCIEKRYPWTLVTWSYHDLWRYAWNVSLHQLGVVKPFFIILQCVIQHPCMRIDHFRLNDDSMGPRVERSFKCIPPLVSLVKLIHVDTYWRDSLGILAQAQARHAVKGWAWLFFGSQECLRTDQLEPALCQASSRRRGSGGRRRAGRSVQLADEMKVDLPMLFGHYGENERAT